MTTYWTLPTKIRQYAESGAETEHIAWKDAQNFESCKNADGSITRTVAPLLHIARSPKFDIKQKTYFLELTGYQFLNVPDPISGILVRVTAARRGRITDETISLCLNQELIGENRATRDLSPIKTYGDITDLWGTQLTTSDVLNSSFGVCIRFQSHPDFPHGDPAGIDTVQIQIY